MIKIKLEAQSGEDMRKQLLDLLGEYGGEQILLEAVPIVKMNEAAPAAGETKPEPARTASGRVSRAKPKAETPEIVADEPLAGGDFESPVPGEEEETPETKGDKWKTYSQDELRAIVFASGNRPGVREILTAMGHASISEIKDADQADFVKKVQALKPEAK